MVFSSIFFLLYFSPIFFVVYYLLPNKLRNSWIIVASIFFYWWGAPSFFFILIMSCLLDYYAGVLYIKSKRSLYYYGAITSNVLLLLYFKYCNFFIDTINEAIGYKIEWTAVALPIGISFLTFQKISYLVDVKRKDGEQQSHFGQYFLYVVLFPQLIAGPIVRYKEINHQLLNRINQITTTNIYLGLRRFIIGLSKKVLIANVLGVTVDHIFEIPYNELSSSTAALGLLAYTFQIYFDFSGYSDMAIGLGKMMGFTFPENFNFPYIARSITEFWRRWHITLSNWMKDYLYIPLGGNRKGAIRTYFNLFIVFFLSGLWHGASWNFILWGVYHGLFLIIERLFLLKVLNKLPSFISLLYNFVIVSFGWLLFRANSLNEAYKYGAALFSNNDIGEVTGTIITTKFYFIFILAISFSFMGILNEGFFNSVNNKMGQNQLKLLGSHISIIILLILCLAELFSSGFNPFIYFKF
ncbi:MAG: MBOAT family protein [Vicingus serpentipes]|nr:MBOAT family protein [Vicingus serpentipes]